MFKFIFDQERKDKEESNSFSSFNNRITGTTTKSFRHTFLIRIDDEFRFSLFSFPFAHNEYNLLDSYQLNKSKETNKR